MILFIDDAIHDKTKQQSGADIKDGVLLDEHGRKDNAGHQQEGQHLNGLIFLKLAVIHHRKMYPKGVVHMDTRKEVGRRIAGIEKFDQSGTDIMVRKIHRTQVLPVWIQG